MQKHATVTTDTEQSSTFLWGEFRFAVVGHLLVSRLHRGQLGAEIRLLSERTWKHPISGWDARFGRSTIERWYYRALNAERSPISALKSPRSDAGSHRGIPNAAYAYLRGQFRAHRRWSYHKHYIKLDEIAKTQRWGSMPSYSTVGRYISSMDRSLEHEPTEQVDKLKRLVSHLRKCLITQSVRVNLLRAMYEKADISGPRRRYRRPGPYEKQYVLSRLRDYGRAGGTMTDYCQSVGISETTVLRWSSAYALRGLSGIVPQTRRKFPNKTKAKQTTTRVLEIFHNQPRTYGINRTSWSGSSLAEALRKEYQESISASTARRHLRKSGYTMRRARQVLTSTDPAYREKVELLLRTLRSLQPDELLFFVDEMGPMRVKKYGGRIYTKRDTKITFPQVQPRRGSVSLAGALSATTNLVTAFFCETKDSRTMVDLVELLFNQHIDQSRIYITWDAASWHSSHELVSWLDDFNEVTREAGIGPIVEFIPLPARAQFLDVIEAVLGGMKQAVIHHSDYATDEEMKVAIARHFEERNEHFRESPRRAGKKIWDINFFSDHEHIRSGNYREW